MIQAFVPITALVTSMGSAAPRALFEASADARKLQTFRVDGLKSPACGTVYPAAGLEQGGMPLGGLGTGYLCLDPDGRFGKCSIFNRLPAPIAINQPFLFLSVGGRRLTLATAKDGAPLPLLLHVGPEYAILPSDPRAASYDCLSWTWWDEFRNRLRGSKKWYRPQTQKIEENLRAGLGEGAVVIFAHCGLPYYAPNWLKRTVEHSEFKTVSRYLQDYPADSLEGGRCYADVSACVTPFRRSYFDALKELPAQSLLFGSDFPTPVFELSADVGEMMADLRAVLKGQWERIVVPQDNLIDVNYRELQHFFPDHPMFTNFNALL